MKKNYTLEAIKKVCDRYLSAQYYELKPDKYTPEEVSVTLKKKMGINLNEDQFVIGDIRGGDDGSVIFDVTLRDIPKVKGYCQRVNEYLEKQNPGKRRTWKIIDYPIDETVSVLFSTTVHLNTSESLRVNNLEIKLLKPVKNGVIISYHFND